MSGWDGWAAQQAADSYYADPRGAERELAAYEADEGPLGCEHEADELGEDEHLAGCLYDAAAARRMAFDEGKWDAQGVSEFGRSS